MERQDWGRALEDLQRCPLPRRRKEEGRNMEQGTFGTLNFELRVSGDAGQIGLTRTETTLVKKKER